jgi:hypothetical protein
MLAFFAQTTTSFAKKLIMTLVSEKNADFLRRKFAKIVTSTPDWTNFRLLSICLLWEVF